MTLLHGRQESLDVGSKQYTVLIAFVAAVGGFLFGYDLVIISGAELQLKSVFSLTEYQYGQAVSSALLGCIVGPLFGAWLCDRIGRRRTLILAAILFGVSAIGTAIPRDITTFNMFRIIGGVGVGLASIASPMYIAEIAPARVRGGLGIMYQLAVVLGATAAVVVAYFLAKHLEDHINWRWMFASELAPVVAFLIFLVFVPESPRWLAELGRQEEALQVLTRVNGHEKARLELYGINQAIAQETGAFSELFQPGVRTALLIGMLLAIFNNWTGWSAIAYYLPDLFQRAGSAKVSDALFRSMIINSAMILFTVLAIWLVDRIGRRMLWLISSLAMMASLLMTAVVFHFDIKGIVVVLTVLMCAWPHAIGLGPLPWLMMSEIQPTRIRARAVAITTTILWIAGYTGTRYFPQLAALSERTTGSIAGIFVLYAIMCVGAFIFGWRLLPETKNRTLEEISKNWLDAGRKA